jgi:hypothetical protein
MVCGHGRGGFHILVTCLNLAVTGTRILAARAAQTVNERISLLNGQGRGCTVRLVIAADLAHEEGASEIRHGPHGQVLRTVCCVGQLRTTPTNRC